jgi:FkbM family methyltransferase
MIDSLERLDAAMIMCRSRLLHVANHPVIAHAVDELVGGFEEGTLQFFDAALPLCRRLIDVGAYIGLLSLYAADRVAEITAFEPSPTNRAFLAANLRLNPRIAQRVTIQPVALGREADKAPLYRKGFADSGSSLFQAVERQTILQGQMESIVTIRPAAEALEEAGLDGQTLLKIDIEGAEYEVIPAISHLLERHRPFLHLSLHPFNLLRLRRAIELAASLRVYPYMYLLDAGRWREVTEANYGDFINDYLLRPKPLPRIASLQYGFIDAVGFSPIELPLVSLAHRPTTSELKAPHPFNQA